MTHAALLLAALLMASGFCLTFPSSRGSVSGGRMVLALCVLAVGFGLFIWAVTPWERVV